MMKKCFLEIIERFIWKDDSSEYILSNQQRECMNCCYFKKCYTLSLGRVVGNILIQLESIHHPSEGEDDNGDVEIVDVEDN